MDNLYEDSEKETERPSSIDAYLFLQPKEMVLPFQKGVTCLAEEDDDEDEYIWIFFTPSATVASAAATGFAAASPDIVAAKKLLENQNAALFLVGPPRVPA